MRSESKSGQRPNRNAAGIAAIVLFSAWTVFECGSLLMHKSPGQWTRAIFLLLALLVTLLSQIRVLPAQNVLLAATLIAVIAGIVHTIGALSGIPFGARIFLDDFGGCIFGVLPWAWPVLWIAFLLNSRGVARLILRPWRKTKNYGFRVIGLTCLLSMALDLGFEPFATHVNHYWIWRTPKNIPVWYDAPWVNFFSAGLTTLLILAFTTPWLINKQPVKRPTDYQPLGIWLAMNFYFALANGLAGLWAAVAVGVAVNVIAAIFAVRGARW